MIVLRILFFSCVSILAVSHISALYFSLYWHYLWLDIPIHFLGGITVVFGISILPFLHIHYFEKFYSFKICLIVVVCIALLWELFEISIGFSTYQDKFFLDTLLDLVMGTLGGVVGYGIVQSVKKI